MSDPVLRPWRAADADALSRAYRSSPDLVTQFGRLEPVSPAAARDVIDQMLVCTDTSKNWAIVVDGVAVGNVGVTAIEKRHETAWAFYWLAAPSRGRGHATRALGTVSDWAFAEGLFRLELGHRVNNPASCRVATRAGFRTEGIERQKLKYGTERFDVELHARLTTDPRPPSDPIQLRH